VRGLTRPCAFDAVPGTLVPSGSAHR
jgi:hypothetical protein